eukprot:IDg3110t1
MKHSFPTQAIPTGIPKFGGYLSRVAQYLTSSEFYSSTDNQGALSAPPTMAKLTVTLLCALLCTTFVAAQKRSMFVVEAGKSLRDIGELVKGAPPLRICPAKYPNGISIRCQGRNVLPPVIMSITRGRVQTEGRAPYHIAGDIDSNGLKEIFPWDDYLSKPKLADGTRLVRVRCRHKTRQGVFRKFSRELIIEKDGCETPPPVLTNKFRICNVEEKLFAFISGSNGTKSNLDPIVTQLESSCTSSTSQCSFEENACSCSSAPEYSSFSKRTFEENMCLSPVNMSNALHPYSLIKALLKACLVVKCTLKEVASPQSQLDAREVQADRKKLSESLDSKLISCTGSPRVARVKKLEFPIQNHRYDLESSTQLVESLYRALNNEANTRKREYKSIQDQSAFANA